MMLNTIEECPKANYFDAAFAFAEIHIKILRSKNSLKYPAKLNKALKF